MSGSGSAGTILQLIGFPGAGKRTIALAMADLARERGERLVVVDSHLTGNPVLEVVDHRGTMPSPAVWSLVYEIRDVVVRAIEAHAPPAWSFVFTNVLTEEGDTDRASVERLQRLAGARESRYVPVVVTCDVEELVRRAQGDGRAALHKLVDPAVVRTYAVTRTLLRPPGAVELEVTDLTPQQAAAHLLDVLAVGP